MQEVICGSVVDNTNTERKSTDKISSSRIVISKNIVSLFIFRAAQFNQTKLISLLVEKGANVNIHDGDGRSPFLNSVAAGHIDSARVLLEADVDVNATDLLMKTCVHIAVENEQFKMLKMLLESPLGAKDLYKADLWDRVPIHYAAKSKDLKVTR